MRVSLNWLRRYLPELQASVEEISQVLTAVGLEVEGIEDQAAAFRGLRVAKVLEREKHPEADKLSVTKVFDSENEIQVVCGAPNVAAGQTVVLAPVGCSLPLPEGETLKIKKAKLRGVESCGMICGSDEIGLGGDHSGILVLDDSLPAGAVFADLPGWYDVVFELNVTPNRPDALSHIGVARELSRAFAIPLQTPSIPQAKTSNSNPIQVELDAGAGCTRYIARVIQNVQVGPSPEWLRRLLESIGIRSISNVVDVTNFILLEWGQPLHAFDLSKIQSSKIHLRSAQEGEKLTTLDGQERILRVGELVVCDGPEAICLAGVMGGQSTEVTEATQNILLETAWFHPGTVRRQARRLGIHSDSSHRFERGVDPIHTAWISEYAAHLIAEICGGTVGAATETISPDHVLEAKEVRLRSKRVEQILGFKASDEEILNCLQGIGLQLIATESESWLWSIPGFRPDLEREIDLIEEIARLIGFDRVPTIFPALALQLNVLPPAEQLARKTRSLLCGLGLAEGLSLRFESQKTLDTLFTETDSRRNAVALQNPLSDEWAVLPTSFVGRMLKAVSHNLRMQEKSVHLFEIAKVFKPAPREDLRKDPGVIESQVLAGALVGDWGIGLERPQVDFGILRGVLDGLFTGLRIDVQWERPQTEDNQSFLHPLRQVILKCGDQVLGFAGELHPAQADLWDLSMSPLLFELNFDLMVQACQKTLHFKPFAKTGAVQRDLSLLVDARMDHGSVLAELKSTKSKLLQDVQLRSVYAGQGIPEGQKNLLYTFSYQAADRTLTDEEVNQAHDKIRATLAQVPSLTLR
jgi:phenylalanyl-tRNA synthetase beta chain